MNQLKNIICFIIFISISFIVKSTEQDSTNVVYDTTSVFTFSINDFDDCFLFNLNHIDTSLISFQFNDPSYKISPFTASLGNIGLNQRNLFYSSPQISFFNAGNHYINNYLFTPDNIEYFIAKKPFTDLYYTTGARKEQVFRVRQSIPFKNNFYLGADYLIINSNGRELFRQKSANEHLCFNSKFYSKNNKYAVFASYIHNKIKNYENGGIQDDVLFENREDKKDNTLFFLNDAESRYKESYVTLNNYYNFFDKLANTENKSDTLKIKRNKLLLSHNFSFKRSFRIYEDKEPASGFYNNIFLNNEKTYDSTFCSALNNEIKISSTFINIDSLNDLFKLSFIIGHEFTKWNTYDVDTSYNGIAPQFLFQITPVSNLLLQASYKTVFNGYSSGDYNLELSAYKKINKNSGLHFQINKMEIKPAFFYNYYLSNNFKWENNFAKQNILNTSLSYFSNNIDVDLSYSDIKNCIYMDVLARPKQLSFSTSIFSASVKTKFDLGNFNINNNILYHKLPEIDVFRYPALQDVLEVSWGKKIFKSALSFRLGFDVIWNSSYYANAYMPATGIFYLQNERKIGNYPYGDVFINLRIKRARIFIKYQHFNNGWSSPAYYSSLHYPSSESSFKIGVSWFFYN